MKLASFVSKWLDLNETPKKIKDIVGYCIRKENGEVFSGADENYVTTMVTYHIAKNTISVVYDGDEVVGVHMWYNCNYDDGWEFVRDWTEDDPNGDAVFLAFLFSDNKNVLKQLTIDLINKEPSVLDKKLIGIRYKHGQPCKVDLSTKYFKKILKL